VRYRRVAGRLLKPGDIVRRDDDRRIYRIEEIDPLKRAEHGTLRAVVRYSYGKGSELIAPDLYYDVRQLPADVQMARFVSQLALGQHDASTATVDAARKLLDNISGESPLAAVNETLADAQDRIQQAVTDGTIPG
jgi:hypothetical protein